MSHVVGSKCFIREESLGYFAEACQNIGLQLNIGQTNYRWFNRWMKDYHNEDAAYKMGYKPEDYGKCAHAVTIPGSADCYEIGLVPVPEGATETVQMADGTTAEVPMEDGYWLILDFYAGGKGMVEKVGGKDMHKLVQEFGKVCFDNEVLSMPDLASYGYEVTDEICPETGDRILGVEW